MTVLAAAKHIDNLAALLPQVEQIGLASRVTDFAGALSNCGELTKGN